MTQGPPPRLRVADSRWLIGSGVAGPRRPDVVVCDPYVSAVHAEVIRDANGMFWVRDMGSSNGTFLAPNGLGAYCSQVRRVRQLTLWRPGWTLWLGGRQGIPQPGKANRT